MLELKASPYTGALVDPNSIVLHLPLEIEGYGWVTTKDDWRAFLFQYRHMAHALTASKRATERLEGEVAYLKSEIKNLVEGVGG